ncbi:hypothetical protein C943_02495 [Mariniradius saccharolyticus AK6]|uniref:Uncharacterized protein n=1 Tax=Mariniradius saccharolyticus AK6 TaxID=1239962 RepID=M7X9M8_9BACT|nr:hypothetical protein C943_02495 [Mariniradius saccharolyticus AK6]
MAIGSSAFLEPLWLHFSHLYSQSSYQFVCHLADTDILAPSDL